MITDSLITVRGCFPAPLLRALGFALPLLVITCGTQAATLSEASADLARELEASQRALNEGEQRINRERKKIAGQLNTLEAEVATLRTKNAAARRAADERNLTIGNIESRLADWREQRDYQRRLIGEYLGSRPASWNATAGGEMDIGIAAVRGRVQDTIASLEPAWRNEDIVFASGELASARVLEIGPASWFLMVDEQRSGVIERRPQGPAEVRYEFDQQGTEALTRLLRQHEGEVLLDPALDYKQFTQSQPSSILEHLSRGGGWVLPILALGLGSIAIVLGKVVQFFRLPGLGDRSAADWVEHLSDADTLRQYRDQHGGIMTTLLDITATTPPGSLRDDQLFSATSQYKRLLESWLGALTVIAAVSPLLGLLGTVSGMIETFKMMTIFGAGDPQVVSGGISKALITTEIGLVVAIPALLAHTLLSRWSRARLARVEDSAVSLSQWGGAST